MSIRLIGHVWETSPYKGDRLLLHLALADFANDEGTCFPSQKTLAKKARTSERWVGISISQMIKDGLLEIVENGKGRGNRNIYKLIKTRTEYGIYDNNTDIKTRTEYGINASDEKNKTRTLKQQNPNSDASCLYKNRNEPSSVLLTSFDAFWNRYPRRVAKVAAKNVFISIMIKPNAPSLETLLASVDSYAKTQTDKKYIAHPATWLRQGRWEDETVSAPLVPAQKDWEMDQAFDRVYPLARMRKSWEDILDALRDFDPRVVEPCKKIYDDIRDNQ